MKQHVHEAAARQRLYDSPAQLQAWQSHRGGDAPEPAAWNARCLCTGSSHWLPARRAQTAQQHVPGLACCSTCSGPVPPPCIRNTTSFAAAFAQIPCPLPIYATQQALLQHLLRSLATSLYMQHNKLCCSICSNPLPPPYICNTTSFAAAFAQAPCYIPVHATQ